MSYIFQDDAWGEVSGSRFTPRFTDEEYQFRLNAIRQLESGGLEESERLKLQQECVRRAQLSIYSQARLGR